MIDRPMRSAVDIAPLGPLADPRTIAHIAATADAAGWDGVSVWDSLGVSMGTVACDPFVALTAAASATERIRLIASVIAAPRRRPQLVAQAAASLDRWSGGRLTLGLGSGGDPADFEAFGESFQAAQRAAMLDESALIIDRFLRGETVEHEGRHATVHGVRVGPAPIQRPRPPIWIGGMKPGALRRAARWDGWIAIAVDESGTLTLQPEQLREMVARIDTHRRADGLHPMPFDVAVFGMSEPRDDAVPRSFHQAGATWWLESLSPMRGSFDELLERVAAGPPGRQ
jgi:alkanesulfonate monooxygenase SsuD/methylene tetrahydromethanopterin reductase-like flavin-dependent oxidoreductase (luciferase family)